MVTYNFTKSNIRASSSFPVTSFGKGLYLDAKK